MIAPTVTRPAPAVAALRARLAAIRGAYHDARSRADFAVAMGDHGNAAHWDMRARQAEREFAAALRLLRDTQDEREAVAEAER